MARFVWQARNTLGLLCSGQEEAASRQALIRQLKTQALNPHFIQRSYPGHWQKTRRQLLAYLKALCWLLQRQLPLRDALTHLADEKQISWPACLLAQLHQDVLQGQSLGLSIKTWEYWLDGNTSAFITLGENTSQLADKLERVYQLYERQAQLKRQFWQAISYPCFLVFITCLMVFGLMHWVIPAFLNLFVENHLALPTLTQTLIYLSDGLNQHSGDIVLILIAISCFTPFIQSACKNNLKWQTWLLTMPVLGKLRLQQGLGRWCYLLGSALAAKLPLLDAYDLALTSLSPSHRRLQLDLTHAKTEITQGKSVYESLHGLNWFAPDMLLCIRLGEMSQSLDRALLQMASDYHELTQTQLARWSACLEPALLLLLAGMASFILFALYLPMVQLGLHL
jgi:type II secretory pathway component PulF